MTPDVPGDLGAGGFQVTDWLFRGAEQAQRVDDLQAGRGGKGKQVVDAGETVAPGARGNQLIDRSPADPQGPQAQVAKESDQRGVRRAEQVTGHTGVAGSKRPPFEAQPGEIARDRRPAVPGLKGDRYRVCRSRVCGSFPWQPPRFRPGYHSPPGSS